MPLHSPQGHRQTLLEQSFNYNSLGTLEELRLFNL